jgi:serine/threonine protein kinase
MKSIDDAPFEAAELKIMSRAGRHPRVTNLYGCCTDPADSKQCLVLERAEHGSISDFFLNNEDAVLASDVLLTVAKQASEAMHHISTLGIVHRDIAARNVLVFSLSPSDRKQVNIKVTDFGRSRASRQSTIHSIRPDSASPVEWMAPESFMKGVWSSETDVWSFGVFMWELYSQCHLPYWDQLQPGQVVRDLICKDRQVLNQPDGCPDHVYAIMQSCWKYNRKERPSFYDLCQALQEALYKELAVGVQRCFVAACVFGCICFFTIA